MSPWVVDLNMKEKRQSRGWRSMGATVHGVRSVAHNLNNNQITSG